mmetsp:Transcript_53217/g.110984  ORF Transcript_53217/g.110984 Transcript_53217/m.110984 type:complete len:245 (-) Transcript_53217:145-879(-)
MGLIAPSTSSATISSTVCTPASDKGTSIPRVKDSQVSVRRITADRDVPSGRVSRRMRQSAVGALAWIRSMATMDRKVPSSTCSGTSIPRRTRPWLSPRFGIGGLSTCTQRSSSRNTSTSSPSTFLAICTESLCTPHSIMGTSRPTGSASSPRVRYTTAALVSPEGSMFLTIKAMSFGASYQTRLRATITLSLPSLIFSGISTPQRTRASCCISRGNPISTVPQTSRSLPFMSRVASRAILTSIS